MAVVFRVSDTIKRKIKFKWPKAGGGFSTESLDADFNLSAIVDNDKFVSARSAMGAKGESDQVNIEEIQSRATDGMREFVSGVYGIGGDDGSELPPTEGRDRALNIKPIADALWREVMSLRSGEQTPAAKS